VALARRGLRGVKLVISDAHECPKAGVTKVLSANWQRGRVYLMRNACVHAGKTQRRLISARIRTTFAEPDAPPPMPSGAVSPTTSAPRYPNWPV